MPLSAGDKLGPYEILAPIGSGGMGDVWRARDTRLYRIVAIKQLKGQHSARFEQEARAIAALNHPNICTLYDVGPDFLVMEYVEGRPLRGPLRVEDAVKLALQIAAALEEAHGRGILHRDLKPGNILVTGKGAAKLLDFGLAKLMTDSDADATKTAEGTVLGTTAYMAPEQAKGLPLDERSDIFSFGAVLYEMLSGHRAFCGDSTAQVLSAVLRDDPPPLHAPVELQRVVGKCLAKQPLDRFSSVGELRVALEKIAEGAHIHAGTAKSAGHPPSIAVLPFTNMSADKENEYFSDGLAEEILNLLANIPGLKVIARTSSFAFRGKEQDIRKIAETLGVSHVLEGSVRRAGNRLRVTAQLIHAADGAHLWSERYDRDMTDVFAIQDEIGQAISEALKLRLAPPARTANIEAFQSYLKGQYYRVHYTAESLAKAKGFFEQALALEPNYAPAYSGLAGYYYVLAALGMKPAGNVAPLAKSAAEKALAIDPANSEARSVLAIVAAAYDYDWKAAYAHFRQAMAAEPVSPTVRYRYLLYYLLPFGRAADAIEQSRLALETDPLSMILHNGMALSMFAAKQYREAIDYARRALEIDPDFYLIWFTMGLAQIHAGFIQEAITSLKRVLELAPWWYIGAGYLAAAYFQAGDRESSQKWVRELVSHRQAFGAAVYYQAAGELDAMFEALDLAYQQRYVHLPNIQYHAFFGPYRSDPRFQNLLERMRLA
jgi:serine/threonine-protein kinase